MSDPPTPTPTPETLARELVALLDVEEINADLYRGARQPGSTGRVFGGQVIAQALQAAQRSIEGKPAHSLHAYFMRPGDTGFPILFRVERDFDGGSFATRRVIATQRGQPILNLAASFQRPEEGLRHQLPMPEVPGPEELRPDRELRTEAAGRIPEKWRALLLRPGPIEIRQPNPRDLLNPQPREPHHYSWFRTAAPIGDDPAMHRAVLAYASDMTLLGTSLLPHGLSWISPGLQSASLDHALWLHEDCRVDDWLLYVTDSPWSGHARGISRGSIYTPDGRLVASVAQEGLIRMRR